MPVAAALIAAILLAGGLVGCDRVHGVSSAGSSNVGGTPGSANDPATGGRGNDAPQGDHP